MNEEEMRPYRIGLQPCGNFKPTMLMLPEEAEGEYYCSRCSKWAEDPPYITLLACTNCRNLHNQDGYDSCPSFPHINAVTWCWCWKCLYEESISLK